MLLAIITMIISILAMIFVPKNLTKIEIYSSTFFALYFDLITDVYLVLKYDLFGYFGKGVEWATTPYIIVVYSAVNFLYLNYFPFKKGNRKQMIYILAWSIFAIIYEKIAQSTELFYYHGWKWWYSALLYPLLFLILVINFKVIRRIIKHSARGN